MRDVELGFDWISGLGFLESQGFKFLAGDSPLRGGSYAYIDLRRLLQASPAKVSLISWNRYTDR